MNFSPALLASIRNFSLPAARVFAARRQQRIRLGGIGYSG